VRPARRFLKKFPGRGPKTGPPRHLGTWTTTKSPT
jgi:hypothetical protein